MTQFTFGGRPLSEFRYGNTPAQRLVLARSLAELKARQPQAAPVHPANWDRLSNSQKMSWNHQQEREGR